MLLSNKKIPEVKYGNIPLQLFFDGHSKVKKNKKLAIK